jgi:hypothetical protein
MNTEKVPEIKIKLCNSLGPGDPVCSQGARGSDQVKSAW